MKNIATAFGIAGVALVAALASVKKSSISASPSSE